MAREIILYNWKMQGVDPMHCEEDDEKILHCKDHSFVCGDFEVKGKKVVNIYVCKECGLHAMFSIPRVREGQTLRGTIYPFTSAETLNKYLDGHKDGQTFTDFLYCDEMITKDILE